MLGGGSAPAKVACRSSIDPLAGEVMFKQLGAGDTGDGAAATGDGTKLPSAWLSSFGSHSLGKPTPKPRAVEDLFTTQHAGATPPVQRKHSRLAIPPTDKRASAWLSSFEGFTVSSNLRA